MTTTTTEAYTGPLVASGLAAIPFDFQAISAAEVGVLRDGVEETDFTVTLNGDGTGSVLPNATWGADEIYIYSKPDYTQSTSFERFAPVYPDQFVPPLDRIARTLIALKSTVARAFLVPFGREAPPMPSGTGFLFQDADGDFVLASGTGADEGLRTDLAAVSGAALIGTSEGVSLEAVAQRPRLLTLAAPKPTAYSREEARTMAADVSGMVGYAAYSGATGGAGKTEYWVTNSSDDPTLIGSLRWAVESAIANGGGMIIGDPEAGQLDIWLSRLLLIGASAANTLNITIAFPGRNVLIRNMPKIEGIRVSGVNFIGKQLDVTNFAQTYVDGEEKDGFSINPLYSDKIWLDECEFGHISDGVGDCASSALTAATGPCRVTLTHTILRNQDKTILLGKSGIVSGTLSAVNYAIRYTGFENWFHAAGQRMPLVQQYAFAHMVNNIVDFAPFQRQDGTQGACEGMKARFGGGVDSYGNLFRALYTPGATIPGVSGDADGAYRDTGSQVQGNISLASANTAYLPAIPYTLTPSAVPATLTAQTAWANAIIAKCGPGKYPFPLEQYVFRTGTPDVMPEGRGIIPDGDGYYERVGPRGLTQPKADVSQTTGANPTRQATKTIAAGAIAVEAGERFFAVGGEGAVADDLVTINGGFDGCEITVRCLSAANPITVKSTGNINLPSGDILLDHVGKDLTLLYDTGSAKFGVKAEPSRVSGTIPTLSSGTFTPTLTAVANCSGLSVTKGQYSRNGNMVTGSLIVTGTQTAASTITQAEFTLPVASDLGAGDMAGMCVTTGTASVPGYVNGMTATDKGRVNFTCSAGSGAAFTLIIVFQYEVK
jgi:pectate lyase